MKMFFLIPLFLIGGFSFLLAAESAPDSTKINSGSLPPEISKKVNSASSTEKVDKIVPTKIVKMTEKLDKKLDAKHKQKVTGTLNVSQNAYNNWEQGGQNAIAWNVRLEWDVARNGGPLGLIYSGDLHFGQTRQEGEDARNSIDKIELDGLLTWKLGKIINPYFGMGLLTQFGRGYDYKKTPFEAKSDFWDPAYLTQSLGMRMKLKLFNSQFGIGLKETFTSTYRQYSDDPFTRKVEAFRMETGLQSKTRLDATIVKGLGVKSTLELFSTFQHIETVDMRWDTRITAKVAKHIIITLNILINYDKDVLDKFQVKESTEIGFQYEFL